MPIQTFVLPNGMQILLEEQHNAPVVAFNALVKVGSSHESPGEEGICHALEHMLFKGTPSRHMGAIAKEVEAAGGEINAYTSLDQTVYYINMASRFASCGLEILADAVRNPLLDEREFEREKEVILEEIRREQDNPARMMGEHLFDHAFRAHPYGRPVIGTPASVAALTRARLAAFHRRWYTPRNIALIAVGDFHTPAMMRAIRRAFGGFRGPPPPRHPIPREPRQTALKLFTKPMAIQSAYLALGFHIPEIAHGEIPALDCLAHALGGADSSRLEQEVKERLKLVHSISASTFALKDPGLFVISAVMRDRDITRALQAIRGEIDRVREEPIGAEELSRAKLNIRSDEIYERETVGGQSAKLAFFLATAGDHAFEQRYYQRLAAVRTEDVREAAHRYLACEAATAVLLFPEGSAALKASGAIRRALAPPPPKLSPTRRAKAPSAERVRLPGGATLIVREQHRLPLVSLYAVAPGGTRGETPRTNGLFVLTARTMAKGTDRLDAVGIARAIEKMAGHLEGFSSRNAVGLRAEMLSEHFDEGFRLFGDVLSHPAFAPEEVERERRLVLSAIKDQEDALSSLAFAEFLKTLFPRHPYGLRALGTAASVKSLARADLVRCHRGAFRARSLVLSVVGDVCAAEVVRLARELSERLPQGHPARPHPRLDLRPGSRRDVIIPKREKQQAHIVVGFMGTTYRRKDRFAMAVLNNILSGQGGRLFLSLRDSMGLAYSVHSSHQEGIEPGQFAVYIGTEPSKQQKAVEAILAELRRIREERVTAEELTRAKNYLVGTYELDLQRTQTMAGIYAFNEFYGLELEEIERYPSRILAVTREEILRTARTYITPDAPVVAIVKPDHSTP